VLANDPTVALLADTDLPVRGYWRATYCCACVFEETLFIAHRVFLSGYSEQNFGRSLFRTKVANALPKYDENGGQQRHENELNLD